MEKGFFQVAITAVHRNEYRGAMIVRPRADGEDTFIERETVEAARVIKVEMRSVVASGSMTLEFGTHLVTVIVSPDETCWMTQAEWSEVFG